AHKSLRDSGYADDDITVHHRGDLKFQGQIFELTVPLPDGEIDQATLEDAADRFPAMYEAEFGKGTAWVDAGVVLMAVRVEATAATHKYRYQGGVAAQRTSSGAIENSRVVTMPSTGQQV